MRLPRPTVDFMNELAARRAPEIELYQELGFPDFFFTDGELSGPPCEVQFLTYGPRECEVMLKGSRVLGHPHSVTTDEADGVPWDGVVRPRTFREYRAHVQSLAPSIAPKSPLGRALKELRSVDRRFRSAEWLRLIDWWALSRETRERHLEPLLKSALQRIGAAFDGGSLTALRLAAELIAPGFARQTLVDAGVWPPSRLGVSEARLTEAFPANHPDRYRVYCRATGEHLGPLYQVQPRFDRELREEELFAEEDRRTSWRLGATGYVLTGDGKLWRREKHGWRCFGPAMDALLVRPPKAERRRSG
ncbi:hypothetical protein WMF11_17945 [Sorangium sp. So ce295]|uniref:hypothetical protein n=1 Tax=Sorangium sp. So ce295 TaxID=3133295 RepID=UPI003F61DBF4